jgi:long-chain fatty acid transport protein
VSDGLAGAGVALPQDATIGAANPAGIVRVGNQYSLGVALFQPSREYSVTGNPSGAPGTFGLTPGTVKSHNDSFGIPNLAYTHRLTDTSSFGLNIYANGGLNTSYPGSAGSGAGTFYGGPAGVNLEQLFFVPSYSVALSKSWAVGASIVGAYQVFSASGLKNFGAFVADGNPDHLTDQGNDSSWSVGGKLGVLYDASPTLSLGAAYQTKTSGSKFSKYSDLFAGRGTFNIPSSTTVGLAWKTSPSSLVAADVQLIKYSDIPAVSNPFSNLTSGSATKLLGGDDGAGFGWRDTTFYKVGYQKDVSQSWTLRGGVAYGKQPIRSSEVVFNILAPGVTEWHYAIGATGKVSKKAKVNVAITYSPSTSVSGSNPLEAPGQQTVALSMKQFQVNASYGVSY